MKNGHKYNIQKYLYTNQLIINYLQGVSIDKYHAQKHPVKMKKK